MSIDLPVIWFVIIVSATLMYIVMDGFDLGIGILSPTIQDADDCNVMANSVAPVWDDNETRLVLGEVGLSGAFPLAYAVIVDALTILLTLMLIGLIFRGIAFEFRFKTTPARRPFWDKAFLGGSILATFTQGVVVGTVLNGFSVTGRSYSGGSFGWSTSFALFCGVGLVVAYSLPEVIWLMTRSESPLQYKMCRVVKKLLLAMLVVIAIISLWTPLTHSAVAERRFNLSNVWFPMPVPLLVALISIWLWRSLGQQNSHTLPFVLTLGLIFLRFSGLGTSTWPYIIPPSIVLWQTAAPAQSQGSMLVGALLITPTILVYTFWSYYVFRGKVQRGEGYH